MLCRFAESYEELHGWKCSETDGECMFLVPNEKACYDIYGEGPLAFEKEENENNKESEE